MSRAPSAGRAAAPGLSRAEIVEVRAALAAGVSPAQALSALDEGVLRRVARAVRLGRPIAEEANTVATGDRGADLLVRALGVAERTGAGAAVAVDQALFAVREGSAQERLLRVHTAQARGTARVLTAVPLCSWLLLVGLDPRSLSFYRTPLGMATLGAAALLFAVGRRWSTRLIRRAERAADRADPLIPSLPPLDPVRGLAAGLPVLAALSLLAGPVAGLACAGFVAALCARPRSSGQTPDATGGGAAEAIELVAVAMEAGLPAEAAIATVARLAPPLARDTLTTGARRLRSGWTPRDAFADTGLRDLGEVLGATERYGAPAAGALRSLAGELRADRRAAAEEAAERVQLSLIFPTTLLTLPAFAFGVVPPLLWTAFHG